MNLYSDDSGSGKGLEDLLSRSDIHAVIIALPIKNQPEYIRRALKAAKHVLSEKPVAENVKEAQELIQWYRSKIDTTKITWGVAENFRYLNSLEHAAEARSKLGKTHGFRLRMQQLVEGGKYFETELVIPKKVAADQQMAQSPNTPRWLSPRRRRALFCGPQTVAG